MNSQEIEARFKGLEDKVRVLEDLEAIQKLQKAYGYYLEHWMVEELIDLFADNPQTELSLRVGRYLGKEGVKRYFKGEPDRASNPEFLHQVMQLSGIVDVAADGKTADGRWYGFGAVALPAGKGVLPRISYGIYTSRYSKENNKWKILKLEWNPLYTGSPLETWVKADRMAAADISKIPLPAKEDATREGNTYYPTGYIVPFHFRHPVSGKETSEKKRNARLKAAKMPKTSDNK